MPTHRAPAESSAAGRSHHLHSAGPARPQDPDGNAQGRTFRSRFRPERSVTITSRDCGRDGCADFDNFQRPAAGSATGSRILLSDGLIELRVIGVRGDEVECEVINGGSLGEHQGINIPGAALSIPALTEKDRNDLNFGLDHGVDMVALSFVRSAADVEDVKKLVADKGQTRSSDCEAGKAAGTANSWKPFLKWRTGSWWPGVTWG